MMANAWKEVSTYLPSIAENVTVDIIFLVLHLYIQTYIACAFKTICKILNKKNKYKFF